MRSRMRGTPAQSGGSFRSVRDEDQLVAWSVGRFAYVVEEVAGGGERGSDLVAGAEAQHGVRGQPGAVASKMKVQRNDTNGGLRSVTCTHACTPPTPGMTWCLYDWSGVHSSQARAAGSRVSKIRRPPVPSRVEAVRSVEAQSWLVRKTWATFAVMVIRSTLSGRTSGRYP